MERGLETPSVRRSAQLGVGHLRGDSPPAQLGSRDVDEAPTDYLPCGCDEKILR